MSKKPSAPWFAAWTAACALLTATALPVQAAPQQDSLKTIRSSEESTSHTFDKVLIKYSKTAKNTEEKAQVAVESIADIGVESVEKIAPQVVVVNLEAEATEREISDLAAALVPTAPVLSVQPDYPVVASATASSTWGIDRINQRDLPLDGKYTYGSTGAGVNVYVIDTGIYGSNREFAGRISSGTSTITDGYGTNDCNGHGTHVAGTIGGSNFGVAKKATLIPVRVLDCEGGGGQTRL